MIRVVIADDQGMMRSGLRLLLDGEQDMTVVGEAPDGVRALDVVRRHAPDVALLDIRMPMLDGIAVTARLTDEGCRTKVILITTFDLDEYVFNGLRAGAVGFVLKDAPADDLLRAVRVVASGAALLDPAVTRRVIERFAVIPDATAPPAGMLEALSPRERDVLVRVAAGGTNAEIAEQLTLSDATVKTHVSNILGKLGARDRVQLVIAAYESGLVRPCRPPDGPT